MVFEGAVNMIDSMAGMTGGLAKEAVANTNLPAEISAIIANAGDFIQGHKRHWFVNHY
jgi:hypothetical protein